jgi:hypothetical protein
MNGPFGGRSAGLCEFRAAPDGYRAFRSPNLVPAGGRIAPLGSGLTTGGVFGRRRFFIFGRFLERRDGLV